MKKVYLTILGIAALTSSYAQKNYTTHEFGLKTKKENVAKTKTPVNVTVKKNNYVAKAVTAVWTEEFEPTSALTTSKGVWTTGRANGSYWSFGTTHPWAPSWTDGLTGSFLKWDSYTPIDASNGGAGEAVFATTSVDGEIISPIIDLSALSTGVVLSFKTETMYCCNANEFPYNIAVSEDGGTTWSTPINIDFGVDRNVPTEDVAKPMNVTVDLSSLTSNTTSQTKIKFIWTGVNTDINGQKNSHYWWLIDDLSIYEKLSYDLAVEKVWLNDIVNGFEHTDIPKTLAGPLTVQAKLKNYGLSLPTNIKVKVTVLSSTDVQIATATGGTLKNNFAISSDTITFATGIDLSGVDFPFGTYKVKVEVTSNTPETNIDNDTLTRQLRISDFYLGQNVFEQGLTIESIGQSSVPLATASGEMKFGNIMSIPASITSIDLHGLEIKYAKNTNYPVTTGEIAVEVYEYNPNAATFNAAFTDLLVQRYYNITAADVPTTNNSIVTKLLNFHQPASGDANAVTLQGGKNYAVVVYHTGGSDHFSYLVNTTDDDNSSVIWGDFGSNPGNSWFVNGKQILTRLSFDETLGIETIESNSISASNLFPNPTTGSTAVNYTLDNASEVSINVVDVAGKVVYSSTEGTQVAGKHTSTIDASSFNTGVYYVTVSTNDSQVTKKLIKK